MKRHSLWLRAALFLLLLAVSDLFFFQVATRLDYPFGDALLRFSAQQRAPDPDIVIVNIDQDSLERMQPEAGNWPWPRAIHAGLLDGLMQQRPRAVVFDMLFNELDVLNENSDLAFNDTLARYPNSYVAVQRHDEGRLVPLSSLPAALGLRRVGPTGAEQVQMLLPLALRQENWRAGVANFLPDADDTGRRYWVYQPLGNWRIPSLPARVLADSMPVPDIDAIMLNWRARTPYRRVSYAELYQDLDREHRSRPADEFRNKIVIVGTDTSGLHDLRVTPLDTRYPGVEIVATALDNLKHGDWLRPLSAAWRLLLLLPALLLLTWAFGRGCNAVAAGAVLGVVTLLATAASYALLQMGLWLPLFSSLAWLWFAYAVFTLLAWRLGREQQMQMVAMFNRVLDPRVVQELVRSGEISKEARNCEITVLFSDIRGFTSLSETRTPEQVVALLNRYFNTQVEIIFKYGGTLDKFIGDAIMAFWGAPIAQPDHAVRAVQAAIEMSAALETFKREMADEGLDFDIGIGVHTGPAVVGFIGSDRRLDYTTIGDAVNLASRIEGQTKGIARVLVSGSTRAACGAAFAFADHGEFQVKGREQAVRLYEPSPLTS